MINQTFFTPEQFLSQAHSLVTIPSLIILFSFIILIFLIVGLAIVEKSRKRFLLIWFISVIFSTIVLLILTLIPSFTQWIVKLVN